MKSQTATTSGTVSSSSNWFRIPANVQHPDTIEAEYGMEDGVLKVRVRAALAGYLLRRWNVDCTEDHSLKGLRVPPLAAQPASPLWRDQSGAGAGLRSNRRKPERKGHQLHAEA
jgi:hypothetical protein